MKRKLLLLFVALLLLFALAACGGSATEAPMEEAAPAEEEAAPAEEEAAPAEEEAAPAEEEAAPAEEEAVDSLQVGEIKDVAREDTVILGWSMSSPIGVTNPWAIPGYTHQEANNQLWEGLSYFRIFADEEAPWLAESMEYNDDYTQLTIKLRPEAMWSDGTPVTSDDVVFTFEGQLNDEALPYHASFVEFVDTIEKVDDLTTVVNFSQPAPRFKFEVLTLKFDTGIPIVPAHALADLPDYHEFPGGLEMPSSGPYRYVSWDQTQKILDLNEDWWAVKAGIADMPEVKRIVMVNIGGQVGSNMEAVAQRLVNNEFDSALDLRQDLIASTLQQNDKITSHTGNEPPYGYLDWWPNALWMNTLLEPYNDPNIRKAIALTIDRDTIDEIVYEGAQVSTIYPFPLYPGLQAFVDQPEVQALVDQYEPRKFDLEESAAMFEAAGYAKNGDGLWEKDGVTINGTIHGFPGIHGDIVPVLEQMLLNGGIDASVDFGDDAYQQMVDGAPGFYMFGHGASLVDPEAALLLYHGRYSQQIGTSAGNNRWSRYNNPEYDAIVDQMGPLGSDDPKFNELAIEALGIYWRDTIDIPIIQWLHRIAYNQTYWENWPTADNLGPGCNGAFWAHTGMLVITNLKKAQ